MRRKVGRKVISTVLTAALITSGFAFQTGDVSAAKKVKKLTLNCCIFRYCIWFYCIYQDKHGSAV